jgi:formylmethanofuran dehydrogenase subunit B
MAQFLLYHDDPAGHSTRRTQTKQMWNKNFDQITDGVTCPGCGLTCDDLKIEVGNGSLKSVENGCELADSHFRQTLSEFDPSPRIEGNSASLQSALDYAAELLQKAQAPLFAGLATDVNGMRSLLSLADRCGATLDHLNGDAMFRNLRVMQDSGWFATTFTEVRNRADLIVLAGSQMLQRFPRLVERVLAPKESLFVDEKERRVVLLGPWDVDSLPESLASLKPTLINVPMDKLSDAVGLLRGSIAGRAVEIDRLGDDIGEKLSELAEDLKQAKYSVVSWSAADLDLPHGELTVQSLVDLVKDLNEKGRSGALPLAGTEGDITTNFVCTWQLGYPLRSQLQQGYPQHDPVLNRWQDQLAREESDLLLWVSSISPQQPAPESQTSTIVLGHAGMRFDKAPALFIPVGVPGIDHPGHWYRSDGVCALPLGQLRESPLPSVREIAEQLNQRLATRNGEPHSC